jgi:hypothetical protein
VNATSSYTTQVGDGAILDYVNNPDTASDTNNVVIATDPANNTKPCDHVYIARYKGLWFADGMSPGSCNLTIISPDGLKTGTATVTVEGATAAFRVVQTRALGSKGGEKIYLRRNGERFAQHTLTTSFQLFTDNAYGEGDISVEFVSDDGAATGRDVRLDYISVDGVKRETEALAVNPASYANGKCGGGGYTEWLRCNGSVNFGALNNRHTLTVRARGNNGGEHIAVLINGQPVNGGWTLGTSFQQYQVNVTGDGDINVRYDNDGGLKDAVIDWLQVDTQTPRQAENMQYNTAVFANGRCGGGSNSEWMHCNGVIGFGKISDNFH